MKNILCFGDSNTWGCISGTANRFPEDVRWTGVLQKELGASYRVIEEGYNGRTFVNRDEAENRPSGIDYFAPCLDSQSPLDLIIIMLGTNDLKLRFGLDAESIAWSFRRYMTTLQTAPMAGQKPRVLLVAPILLNECYKSDTVFYSMFGEKGIERSRALAPALERTAKELGAEFMDAARFACAAPPDGIHMDAASHARLGAAMAARVREILG